MLSVIIINSALCASKHKFGVISEMLSNIIASSQWVSIWWILFRYFGCHNMWFRSNSTSNWFSHFFYFSSNLSFLCINGNVDSESDVQLAPPRQIQLYLTYNVTKVPRFPCFFIDYEHRRSLVRWVMGHMHRGVRELRVFPSCGDNSDFAFQLMAIKIVESNQNLYKVWIWLPFSSTS